MPISRLSSGGNRNVANIELRYFINRSAGNGRGVNLIGLKYCFSEHWLHRMLVPMSMTRVTAEMYEEQSFLRKRGLLTFLRQILEPLDEFDIVLENSLTQGI